MVHPGGRPRTVTLPPEQMIKLGEEMVEFVKTHPDILHITEWYSIEKMITSNQWNCMLQAPEFLPYYEIARNIIGKKYLDKKSNVRDNISPRWQRLYFGDLKKEEDETFDRNEQSKAKELASIPTDVLEKHNQHMQYMENRQKEAKRERREQKQQMHGLDKEVPDSPDE